MQPFRACLIRRANQTYHMCKNGECFNLGNISGIELRKLAREMLLPVVHVWIDIETCPPSFRPRYGLNFKFEPPPFGSEHLAHNTCWLTPPMGTREETFPPHTVR